MEPKPIVILVSESDAALVVQALRALVESTESAMAEESALGPLRMLRDSVARQVETNAGAVRS